MDTRTIKRLAATGAAVLSVAVAASPALASSVSTSGVSASVQATKFSFRGMQLNIPSTWKIDTRTQGKDWVELRTTACTRKKGLATCPSVWVLGPKYIKSGSESSPYNASRPFHPSTGVLPCPGNSKAGLNFDATKPTTSGFQQVGAEQRAIHRVWTGSCRSNGGKKISTVTQREWFLPKQGILVVDQWKTSALPEILKSATWSSSQGAQYGREARKPR